MLCIVCLCADVLRPYRFFQQSTSSHSMTWRRPCQESLTNDWLISLRTLKLRGWQAGCGHPNPGRSIVARSEQTTMLKGGTTGSNRRVAEVIWTFISWALFCLPKHSSSTYKRNWCPSHDCADTRGNNRHEFRGSWSPTGLNMRQDSWQHQHCCASVHGSTDQ